MPPNTLGMLFLLNHLTTRTSHSCSVVCLYMYCMLSTCMQRSYGSRDIALTMHSDINIRNEIQWHYNPHTPHTVSNRPLREFILYTVSLVFNIHRNGCFSNLKYCYASTKVIVWDGNVVASNPRAVSPVPLFVCTWWCVCLCHEAWNLVGVG